MSTVKISQLPNLPSIAANTSNTLFLGVDLPTGVTGKFTATTLANQLYSNNSLIVGNSQILLPNTIGQFVLSGNSYVQLNMVNANDNGTFDIVVTANTGNDSTYFFDAGFANKNYEPGLSFNNIGNAVSPLDGYVYVQGNTGTTPGGNLIIGTTTANTSLKFIVGGGSSANIVAYISSNSLVMNTGSIITTPKGTNSNLIIDPDGVGDVVFPINTELLIQSGAAATSNTTGALQVTGGVGMTGNLYSGGVYLTGTGNGITFADGTTQSTAAASNAYTQSAYAFANSVNVIQTGINSTQNTWISSNAAFTQAAFAKANSSVQNTANILIPGNVTFNGANTNFNGYVSIANNLAVNNVFSVNVASQVLTMNGIIGLYNSSFPATNAAIRIDGSNNGVAQATTSSGTMLQVIGLDGGYATRVLLDNYNAGNTSAYPLFAGRAARGNSSNPTGAIAGDILLRVVGNAYGNSYTLLGGASFDVVALENYSDTTKGSQINLTTTPVGTNTRITTVSVNSSSVVVNSNASFVANTITANTLTTSNGIINTVRVNSTSPLTINFTTDIIVRANLSANFTVTPASFVAGKEIDVWLTNTSSGAGANHTITHGVSALNSTVGATTFTLTGTQSAWLKYMCADGTLANTFVAITYQ